MLATILKSSKATKATLDIIQAFAKFRELSRTLANIVQTTDENSHKLLLAKSGNLIHDLLFKDLEKTAIENSLEFNFGIMKIKHNTKRERKNSEELVEIKELLQNILKKIEGTE
jgi:hypothetical protein